MRDETEAFIKPVEDNLARTRLSLAGTRLAGERNVSFELSRTDVRDAIEEVISVRETAKLSFQFSVIWVCSMLDSLDIVHADCRRSSRYVRG